MKKLNFACGPHDIKEDWDNCDGSQINLPENVIYCDANVFPFPFEDNTYDYILIDGAFCLFKEPRKVLDELHRICKKDAIVEIETPHYTNRGAYIDLDTIHYYSDMSFFHYVDNNCRFNEIKKWEIVKLENSPSQVGRWLGKWLRDRLSLFINGLFEEVEVQLRVIK